MKIQNNLSISIDGPAGAGKSYLAKELFLLLGLKNLSGGMVFRGLAYFWLKSFGKLGEFNPGEFLALCVEHTFRLEFIKEGTRFYLDGVDVTEELMTLEVTEQSALMASYPEIQELVSRILSPYLAEGGLILEGRNSGTSIFPEAKVKLFLTAEHEERVRRRLKQMGRQGPKISYGELSTEIWERDLKDIEREVDPLRVPEGAIIIDTTLLSQQEVVEKVLLILEARGYLER